MYNIYFLFKVNKNQTAEMGASSLIEEETDPSLGFAALHRHFALASGYRIKEEPNEQDLLALQELLA